jgi:ribosomal protein S15P/S13E
MSLTNNEITEYLKSHLPYRLNSLMAHDIILYRQKNKIDEWARSARSPYEDSLFLEPAFEISLVFGRSLMEFLGIKYDRKNDKLKKLDPAKLDLDDITLKSLFPQRAFCTLQDPDLIKHEVDIAILFKVANKSVAHLTSKPSNEHEHARIPKARKAIYDLLLKYVPEMSKDKLWYHTQIESLEIRNIK